MQLRFRRGEQRGDGRIGTLSRGITKTKLFAATCLLEAALIAGSVSAVAFAQGSSEGGTEQTTSTQSLREAVERQAGKTSDDETVGIIYGEGTNVFVKTKTQCDPLGLNNAFNNDAFRGMSVEDIYNRAAKDDDWKGANLVPAEEGGKIVTLAQMDDALSMLISDSLEGQFDDFLEELAKVWAGAAEAVALLPGLIVANVAGCSILEYDTWADYYRSLCYPDDAKFVVYKAASAWEITLSLQTIGQLLNIKIPEIPFAPELKLETNQLIVLPVESNDIWTPPTAKIHGTAYYWGEECKRQACASAVETTTCTDPQTTYSLVEMSFTITGKKSGYLTINPDVQCNTDYTFTANACNNPTYTIRAEMGALSLTRSASTALAVEEGGDYMLDFYFDTTCTSSSDYLTFCRNNAKGGLDYAVSCRGPEGYQTNCTVGCTKLAGFTGIVPTVGMGGVAFKGDDGLMHIYNVGSGAVSDAPKGCSGLRFDGVNMICGTQVTNLETGAVYNVIPPPSDDSMVWGDIHIYSEYDRRSGHTVTLVNLATNQSTVLSTGFSDMDGDRLVYGNCHDNSGNFCDIMLHDLQTDANYEIGAGLIGNIARISGNYVVFASNDNGTYAIQLVDISDPSSPKRTQIFDNIRDYPIFQGGRLDIFGDHVVFARLTSSAPVLLVYDIHSGSSQTIFTGVLPEGISLYGDTVTFATWSMQKDAQEYSYMCKL